MNELIRVGVVGAGARCKLALKAEPRGKVVAAVETSEDAAQRVHDRLGVDVAVCGSVRELIDFGIDVAFVTSPDDTHHDVTVELLEAGVPVYLEKPLAIHLDDATHILEVAYQTRTKLYLGHNMRHMQVVRMLRDIVRRGEIGQVKAIWCRHFVGSGGDFYFKDWHSEREHVNGLLLQKAAHDIDVMDWIADSHATDVVGMGGLTVYGDVNERGGQPGKLMPQWHSLENWPPLTQRGLSDKIDVEDLSMMLMQMENGVYASYEQCHFTPDYWRNYTVIGTEGRAENFGDGEGGVIKVWNKRTYYNPDGDVTYPIEGDANGHDDADALTVAEFLEFAVSGAPTDTNPLDAWYAVAAGIGATDSIRDGSTPRHIEGPAPELVEYFRADQPAE